MTGSLRKSVTIGACLVFIVMDRRADFYSWDIWSNCTNWCHQQSSQLEHLHLYSTRCRRRCRWRCCHLLQPAGSASPALLLWGEPSHCWCSSASSWSSQERRGACSPASSWQHSLVSRHHADVALLLDNNSSCLFYRGAVVDVGSCVFGQPRVWRHPSAFSAATRRVATRLEVKVQPWCKLQEDQRAQTVQVISARRVAAASPAQESTAHGAVHSTLALLLWPS